MYKYILLVFLSVGLGLSSCQSDSYFKVKGVVDGAEKQVVYLEAAALNGIVTLDSAVLRKNGQFSFKQVCTNFPEFYRLRVENKVINFSVDSTETINFKIPYANFATKYEVEGSENSAKIKELVLLQARLQQDVDSLVKAMQNAFLNTKLFEERMALLLESYKDNVKKNYIFDAPNKPYAYFALFQRLNNFQIFDPLSSKDDNRCFAAVATSMSMLYPESDRSKNLQNIVLKGMRDMRNSQPASISIPKEKISELGIIDIVLKNLEGTSIKLSDLKGKVVLLDFTVYQSQVGAPHNLFLRELYAKYAHRGLEIYQVSLDNDEHFWKTSADKLPWVCVRDAQGSYSNYVSLYNIQRLPTFFIIDRNSELKARMENVKDLDAEIQALL